MVMIDPPPPFAEVKDNGYQTGRWTEDAPEAQHKGKRSTYSIHGYSSGTEKDGVVHFYPNAATIYSLTPDMAEATALALIEAAKIARGM